MARTLISDSRLLVGEVASASVLETDGEVLSFTLMASQVGANTSLVRLVVKDSSGRVVQSTCLEGSGTKEVRLDAIDSDLAASIECLHGSATVGLLEGNTPMSQVRNVQGWADYNHSGTLQVIPAGAWTQVVNDAAGPYGDREHLPIGYGDLYNSATNRFHFNDLPEGSQVKVRVDTVVTPDVNNTICLMRFLYDLNGDGMLVVDHTYDTSTLATGAGVPYPRVTNHRFYIGSYWNPRTICTLEIYLSCQTTLLLNGYYIQVN